MSPSTLLEVLGQIRGVTGHSLMTVSLGRHVNAATRKSLEIQAHTITKPRTLLKRKFV